MTTPILTINAGSSSIKVALFENATNGVQLPKAAWSGQADGLGAGLTPKLKIHDAEGKTLHDAALSGDQASQAGALRAILDWRKSQSHATAIAGVGHRIVHGGMHYTHPVRVDDEVLVDLQALSPLAPLHQPHNVAGVRAAMDAFPGVPQVVCFDTAFHADEPAVNRRFAIPASLHDSGVRRYGFHGLSYESIVSQLAGLDPALARGRVVVAHLGNGASMCALDAGRSIATTMSFSPLDGLTMGTRCGHIDAAAVLYLIGDRHMSTDAVTRLLYQESGLLGLSGVSSDMRELEKSALPAAAEAIEHFVEQVLQNLGAMAAALRGIDALVLTGGIGENAAGLRERILQGAAWMGFQLNAAAAEGPRLTTDTSPIAAWTLRTDEEAVIARHVLRHMADAAST